MLTIKQNLLFSIALITSSIKTVTPASIPLTKGSYADLTKNKTVFIKLFAPWCGHCKELEPHWGKMANEWTGEKQGLVAEVDCTQEEEWCVSLGIAGFPTLLFGDPSQGGVFLETYTGVKTYEDLSEFANTTLTGPVCSAGNFDLCDDETKEKIKKYWKLPPSDIREAIDQRQSLILEAEKDFETAFNAMQAQYDSKSQEYEMAMARMKSDVKVLKTLLENK